MGAWMQHISSTATQEKQAADWGDKATLKPIKERDAIKGPNQALWVVKEKPAMN